MWFTLGDLLTILIVFIILLVYRQLDRNNRSLEKVKRFSDKAKEELDKIVQDKAAQLKDIGIELEVHQKTAKEILKRIKDIEDGLQSRASDMEQIGVRIGEYDNVLSELSRMTASVEENIGRLREESEFIDTVGKRIKTASSQIGEVEKSIPTLVEEFSGTNGRQLDQIADASLAKIETAMKSFATELRSTENFVSELRDFVKDTKEKSESLARETEDRLTSLSNDILARAREEKEESMELLESGLVRLRESADRIENECREQLETLQTRGGEIEADVLQTLESGKAEFSRSVEGLEKEFEEKLEAARQKGDGIESGLLRTLESELAVFTRSVQELEKELDDRLEAVREKGGRMETDAAGALESSLASFMQSVRRVELEYGDRLESVRVRGEALETEALKQLSSRIETDIAAAGELALERVKEMEAGVAATQASVVEKVTMLEIRSSEDVESARERILAAMEDGAKKSEEYVKSSLEQIRSGVDASSADIDSRIGELTARIDSWQEALLGRVEKFTALYHESADRTDAVAEEIGTKMAGLTAGMEALEKNLEGRMVVLDDDLRTRLEETQKRGAELTEVLYRKFLEEQEKLGSSFRSSLEEKQTGLRKTMETAEKEWSGQLSVIREQLHQWKKNNDDILDSYRHDIAEELKAFKSDVGGRISENREELVRLTELSKDAGLAIDSLQGKLRDETEAFEASIKAAEAVLKEKLERSGDSLRARLERSETEIGESIGQADRKFTEQLAVSGASLHEKLEQAVADAEASVLGEVEKRLQDYESGLSYRFERMDSVNRDIESLEQRLKDSIRAASASAYQDFEAFENEIAERRKARIQQSEDDFAAIRNSMQELEDGLADLKKRAYESVSAKLKLFEDDFFADLTERSGGMERKMDEWQTQVGAGIASISESYVKEREAVEKAFKVELKQKLAELQARILQHIETFEEQVHKFQEGTQSKIALSEKSFQTFQDTLKNDLAALEKNTIDQSRDDLEQIGLRFSDMMRKHEKDVELRLKSLKELSETGCRDIASLLDASRSEVMVWQAKVLQQMKDSESEIGDSIMAFKADSAQNITRIRETFTAEKEDLVTGSIEERQRLHQELEQLSARIDELSADIRQRSVQSLETFTTGSEAFLLEFNRRVKDLQIESDQKIRDLRTAIQETREASEVMQKKLYGKIEENARILTLNLTEIDKKQKNFVDQTKIFERADSLKVTLQENVEELQTQIQDIASRHKDLKEMETQFLKIRKLADDINAKTAKFAADKRRIDLMEEDFQRLTSLSQTVDTRLGEVMASNDALQSIQARIRNLSELEQDVEARYERLEQKRTILDVTAEGVDKNFKLLDALDKDIKSIQETVNSLPRRLEDVDSKLGELSRNKGQAEEALRQLKQLDTLLKDVENRTEQLQKMREWLARTETRIEEVRNETEQQVKLLGSILKEDRKGSAKEKGAPPMGVRETVVKLAHQGWSIEEIAKVTKISRGEVELILEIAPNK